MEDTNMRRAECRRTPAKRNEILVEAIQMRPAPLAGAGDILAPVEEVIVFVILERADFLCHEKHGRAGGKNGHAKRKSAAGLRIRPCGADMLDAMHRLGHGSM